MTLFTLDLNDTRLRLFRDTTLAAESPGFAIVSETQVLLGDNARGAFRLHPRQANNQFWHRLSMDPLASRGPNAANHADLVYRHLKHLLDAAELGSGDELLLAVAGTTTADQLGLLLGVSNELDIPITGLVDAAVAASVVNPVPSRVVHIDVSLHRSTLTAMHANDFLTRRSASEIAELGLVPLLDTWVNVIADRFVSETRFDPLRIAETEQQVYDQIYAWAESDRPSSTRPPAGPELAIEVENQDNLRRVDVSTQALTDKAQQRYRLLDRALEPGVACLLSHRAASLPGLEQHLAATGHSVLRLGSTDVVAGIQQHLPLIRSAADALRFVTSLPCAASERPTVPTVAMAAPTHLVFAGVGVAINAELALTNATFGAADRLDADVPDGQIRLVCTPEGVIVEPVQGIDMTLNDTPLLEPRALHKGDVLTVGNHRFSLIRVDDGT